MQYRVLPPSCLTGALCSIREVREDEGVQTHGHQLAQVKSGKYLGVTLTENLSWNAHVDQVTKKANNSLAFLRRNLSSCPSHIKAKSYQTMVRPVVEYASSAWDPHTDRNTEKLEAVQRRAARFVTGDYRTTSSVSDMISNLGWESLQHRRTEAKLIHVMSLKEESGRFFFHFREIFEKCIEYIGKFLIHFREILNFC